MLPEQRRRAWGSIAEHGLFSCREPRVPEAGWEAGGAPGHGQSFRNCAFIFPASKPESAWGGMMTHRTPEIVFMGIDP